MRFSSRSHGFPWERLFLVGEFSSKLPLSWRISVLLSQLLRCQNSENKEI